jgi:hypothetical protein
LATAPLVFQAKAVYVGRSEQAGCFMVALADHAEGTDQAFICMLADSFDEGDRLLAMDTYVLVTGSGSTHHGGVVAARVNPDSVEFRLTAAAATALGIPPGFAVGIDPARAPQVRTGLARVLGEEVVQ